MATTNTTEILRDRCKSPVFLFKRFCAIDNFAHFDHENVSITAIVNNIINNNTAHSKARGATLILDLLHEPYILINKIKVNGI